MDFLRELYQYNTIEIKTKYEKVKRLIEHNGEKGTENERILSYFLRGFLPKNYTIGRGFLIDKNGNQSNQCDLVIYDNQYNPNIMTFESNCYFPIESVYCVIEVKTTLRLQDIKKSFEDLQKIRKLHFVEEMLAFPKNDDIMWSKTEYPHYILFAYDTDYKTSEALLKSFENLKDGTFFDMAFILNVGLIRKITSENKTAINLKIPPVLTPDDRTKLPYLDPSTTIEGISYPVFSNRLGKFSVDYIRNFLIFLYLLNDYVTNKKIGTNYLFHYFPIEDPTINDEIIVGIDEKQ